MIRLVGERGTQSIYSWTEDITVGSAILDTGDQAESRYEVLEGMVDIWFIYPLEGDVQLIHHDPTVAMDEEGFPPREEEPSFVPDNPVIMGLGLLIGILVVGASIYIRNRYAKSRKGGGI